MPKRGLVVWLTALVIVLASPACSEQDPCSGEGPPPQTPQCTYRSSYRTCREELARWGRHDLADELGAASADDVATARAFAARFRMFEDAAFDGCLAGLRADHPTSTST
jgi:hypothetical protein